MKQKLRKSLPIFLASVTLIALTACQVHFIAPYDQKLDTAMTTVQGDTEAFFIKLQGAGQTDAGDYDANKHYYQQTEATLRTLLTRAQATPNSAKVADEIDKLEKNVELIQQMHERDKSLNAANIQGDRDSMEIGFRAFFTLELGLKTSTAGSKTAATGKAQARK
jgi:hypothetical protein